VKHSFYGGGKGRLKETLVFVDGGPVKISSAIIQSVKENALKSMSV
jgi:hypothetical protein